ncbi:hypothetical protein QBC39DRAFT_24814 [Podospora conica]|nr:hypothetical protein QBC39DRAFT_24814 [Schizothecium conicum]
MRAVLVLAPALLGVVAASETPMGVGLLPPLMQREELETCCGPSISENNGDREVVIVVDSSMSSNDPGYLGLLAAHADNAFLISQGKASSGKKPVQVAVVSFDSNADTAFGPGDPGDTLNMEAQMNGKNLNSANLKTSTQDHGVSSTKHWGHGHNHLSVQLAQR